MAFVQPATRRLIFAGGFAVAVAVAPALAAYAGPIAPAPRPVAEDTCDNGETMDAFTLQCVPEVAPGGGTMTSGNFVSPGYVGGGGAPSENQLTETNPGIASPSHR